MALDVIFTNGTIHTQDPERPVARALGVHHGRVVSLDDDLAPELFDRTMDLRGATVVPGFHDAHCHLTMLGEALVQVDLRPTTVPTLAELLDAVAAAARDAAPGEWVLGQGYDQNHLGGSHPTAEALDAVAPENPVWLWHNSRHMAVVNTAAFEAAGYPGRTGFTVPEGGSVPLDEHGAALGLLEETARGLVSGAMPPKTAAQVAEQIGAASDVALAAGITSVTEPGLGAPEHLGQSVTDLAAYQLAREQGRLGVRATVMPYLTTLHPVGAPDAPGAADARCDDAAGSRGDDAAGSPPGGAAGARGTLADRPFGLDLGLRTGLGDDRLRIGAVKVLADGSLIGRSAFMTEDYAADTEAGVANAGYLQFPREWLEERLTAAHANGWQLAVHAIGDGAVDVVLDVLEAAQRRFPREDCRHRIEHFGVASDEQVARAARLGVVPVPQGRFVNELGDGIARAMGEPRTRFCYRMRSLLDAGMVVPASTDAPVVDYPPLANIHDMVNRSTSSGAPFVPEERVTVAEAVHAYTVGSAYASHQEHEKGRLVPGMLADFAVLSDDIHTVDPATIRDLRVTATVVGGEVAHGSV